MTGARSVLIIDDNEALAEGLRYALEDAGFVAVVAPNGAVALSYLACMTPDFILYDVVMPELDGAAVVEALDADWRLRDVPRAGMSGQRLCLRLPPNETLLCKPFELRALLELLRRSEGVETHAT